MTELLNPYEPPRSEIVALPESAATPERPDRWFVFHALLWVGLFALLWLIVPKIKNIFADFGISIPAPALPAFAASQGLVGFAVLALPGLMLVLIVDAVLMRASSWRSSVRGRGIALAALPLGMIVYVIASVSFCGALLIQRLGG